jgi:hypothetical protein
MRPPLIGSHLSGQRVAWLNAEEASAVLSAYVLIETGRRFPVRSVTSP